jgi:threonine aldolase
VAASRVPAARIVRDCATVSVCLSKGLGAPVGSLVVGSASYIERALRLRKVLGGGMRQAGVIAAAGLVGLTEHAGRLGADHARAQVLAKRLREVPGVVGLDPSAVATNIVFFDLDGSLLDPRHFLAAHPTGGALAAGVSPGTVKPGMELSHAFSALVREIGGVAIGAYGHGRLRAVTHHQVTDEDIDRLIDAARAAAGLLSSAGKAK